VTAPLNVAKVVLGAFVVPWWNRRAFCRALAIPLISLASLSVAWKFTGKYLPELSNWLLYILYAALFTLFAVICHRLVLLDPGSVALVMAPRWSRRETRFIFFIVAVSLVSTTVAAILMTLLFNMFLSHAFVDPSSTWFGWLDASVKIPVFYLFARFSLVFPATAIDRKVNLQWSWALTRNNGWRLFVVVSVLPWIISQVVSLLYRGEASALEIILLTVLGSALLAVEVAALSLSYRELTKEEASAI
jgi:hypothetical protein